MTQFLIDPTPNEFGSSFHGALFRCMQSAAYRYLDPNAVSHSSPPLIRGSLVHVGLAHHLTHKAIAMGQEIWHDEHCFRYPHEVLPAHTAIEMAALQRGNHGFVQLAKDVVDAYHREYSIGDPLRPLAIEHTLTLEVPDDNETYLYKLRIDEIAKDENGRIWIIDHKTSSYMKNDLLDAFSLDSQFLGLHHLGLTYYGDQFAGVMVQVVELKKGSIRFERKRVGFAPAALRKFPDQVRRIRREWNELQRKNTGLHDYPTAFHNLVCRHSYGLCEYSEQCKFGSAT